MSVSNLRDAVAASSGNTIYGASAGGGTVAPNATSDSAASRAITTTAANTTWLIDVSADLSWSAGLSGTPNAARLAAKVDGSYVACSGGVSVVMSSNVGYEITELPVSGRCVVTLASAGTHTILAAVSNGNGGTVTVQAITITMTQIS